MRIPILIAFCFGIFNSTDSTISIYKYQEGLKCESSLLTTDPIEWFYNNIRIYNGDKYTIQNSSDYGLTTSTLNTATFNVDDEGDYKCRQGGETTDNFTLFFYPFESHNNVINVLYAGEPISIDCNVTLGESTVSKNCAYSGLYYFEEDLDATPTDPHHPSFDVMSPDRYQYRCRIDFPSEDGCSSQAQPVYGPIYSVTYPPLVDIAHNGEKNVVSEGATISLECSYTDRHPNANTDYTIIWNVANAEKMQPYNIKELNFSGAMNETLQFSPSSNAVVSCTVKGSINGFEVINQSSSLHLTVIPNLSGSNIRITAQNCGRNLTIHPNFSSPGLIPDYVTVLERKITVQNNTDLYIGNATEVVLAAAIDGIEGNKYTVEIPKCTSDDDDNLMLVLNLVTCKKDQGDEQIEENVSSLLNDVVNSCQEQVCINISKQDWNITKKVDCLVSLSFKGVPTSFISAIKSFCQNNSDRCEELHEPPTTPTPTTMSTITTPTVTTTVSPHVPPMATWMIICLSSIAVLVLLVAVLLLCVVCKCVKHHRRKRDDLEQQVTTLSVTGSPQGLPPDHPADTQKPPLSRCSSKEALRIETQSQSSNFSDNCSEITKAETRSQVSSFSDISNRSFISTSTSQSRCSRCSCPHTRNSTSSSIRSSRPALPPSSLSNTSYKHDPSIGVTLNLTINDSSSGTSSSRELSIALPFVPMFNDLGALASEGRTQNSSDTGFISEMTHNNSHESNSHRRTLKSSGYGGSRMPHLPENDPNILNPFGKIGYSDSSRSDSSVCSQYSFKTPRHHEVIQGVKKEFSCSRV